MIEKQRHAIVDLLENHRLSQSPENRIHLTDQSQTSMDTFCASPSFCDAFTEYSLERIMTTKNPDRRPDPYATMLNLESELLSRYANGVLLGCLDTHGDIVADQKAIQKYNQTTVGEGVPLVDAFVIPFLGPNIEQIFAKSPPEAIFKVRHEVTGNLKNRRNKNGQRYINHKMDLSNKLRQVPYYADNAPTLFSVPQNTKIPTADELGVPVKVLEYPIASQDVQNYLMAPAIDQSNGGPIFPVVFARLPLKREVFNSEIYRTSLWQQLEKEVIRLCREQKVYSY